MAISRLNGKQIRPGVLSNSHIAADAAIEESKLAVNWDAHYAEALETKKVVDYVQVGNKVVSGVEYNLSLAGVLVGTAPLALSAGTEEGIVTDAPYNKVVIRDSVTGDSLLDVNEREVFGRLVHDGVDFKVMFFTTDGATEDSFTMAADTEIDFQYMERFNLRTISELFSANEKFVSGSADISAFQNIHQLANDLYGSGYSLDRDGKGNLTISISEQITNEATARAEAITLLREDLATGQAGLGANLLGIQDVANVFAASTVEGALAELESRLTSQEQGGGAEVTDAHDSELTGVHADLDTRLEADTTELLAQIAAEIVRAEAAELALDNRVDVIESRVQEDVSDAIGVETLRATEAEGVLTQAITDEQARAEAAELALSDRADDLETEVQTSRGSEASLDIRLDRALKENGTLKEGTKIHEHFRGRFHAVGGEAEVLLSTFTTKKAFPAAFQVGDDSLEVYINGQLQEEGLNYQEAVTGDKIVFNVGDGTVLEPTDVIQVKFRIDNAE
jgi:hypothetical protein